MAATRTAERYLGYWSDPELEFHHYCGKAITKAYVSLKALRSLEGTTRGASPSAMRRIYQAEVIPQMLFGVSASYQPMLISKRKARTIIQSVVTIQKREACWISEAFSITAAEALNTEISLPSITIHMNPLVKKRSYNHGQDHNSLQ